MVKLLHCCNTLLCPCIFCFVLLEFSGFIESSVFNITAYHGDNIYIDCRATTNSLLSVTWYKGSLALSPTQRIITLPDGILVISNVTDSDTGNYTCHLNLVSQYKEKTVEVRIRTPSGMIMCTVVFMCFE